MFVGIINRELQYVAGGGALIHEYKGFHQPSTASRKAFNENFHRQVFHQCLSANAIGNAQFTIRTRQAQALKNARLYGNSSAAIQAIDPLGYVERTEYRHSAPGVGYSESQVPAGMGMLNNYLNYRNSFIGINPLSHRLAVE